MPVLIPHAVAKARHLSGGVLHHKQEIMFRDGSAVNLHEVHIRGCYSVYLRAAKFAGSDWLVFDLRNIAKSLCAMADGMQTREVAGVIFQTLRMAFRTVDDLRTKVDSHLETIDLDEATGEVMA